MAELAVDGQVQENALAGAVEVSHDAAPEPATAAATPKPRVLGPDLLRGLLMMLQAIDHCALAVGAWSHGVALDAEVDSAPMSQWNATVPFIARMLTHVCAPGFMFLLGMGIVYFGRSRTKLGWSAVRLARHFALRGVVLALLNQIFVTLPAASLGYWLVNPVLVALAVNYVLAGLLWMALTALETTLATALAALESHDAERQPLIDSSSSGSSSSSRRSTASSAQTIAWHVHNVILAAVTAAAVWWNMALSPHGGRCVAGDDSSPSHPTEPVYGLGIDFWFFPIFSDHIMSGFPPLAWFSYATLGLLYGRLVTARPWRAYVVNISTAVAGAVLALLFALTRLLHVGNLSENCLHMPEHHHLNSTLGAANQNQYLASLRSFLYVVKYPPDAAFFALTMALNFFLLAFFGTWSPKAAARFPPFLVFGTSALFFYLIHMWLYQTLGIPAKFFFGHDTGTTDPMMGKPIIGVGNGLVMWVVWLLGLAILYPVCRWYGRFKSAKAPDSVWRFF